MRKLTLDPESLRVQSFATLNAGVFPIGTVHAGQKEPTGWHDPHCSAVLPCESKLGCSEVNTCRPTRNHECPSGEAACPSAPDCTPVGVCPADTDAAACPPEPGPTEGAECRETGDCERTKAGCPVGPWSALQCTE